MANFYLREDLEGVSAGDDVELHGAEARHAVTVSRTRVGESLLVGNGRGLTVRGIVSQADPARVVLRAELVEVVERPSPRVTLVQALAKGGRDELAVQAATELGVDTVIPWSAERSVARWEGAKAAKGHDRWAAIVREAAKQSMRPWIPAVRGLASTRALIELAADARMLVLEPTAQAQLSAIRPDERDLVLVVGPEGGISPAELDALRAAGGTPVRMGSTVLRTSTAGPAALAVVNTVLERW
jgi:16S rRNA (uracil1498-N3)-methyltransferase